MGLLDDLLPKFPPGTIRQVAGVVKVLLNGVDYQTKPGAVLDMGGDVKSSQFGDGARTGFSTEPVPSSITVQFLVYNDTDMDAIKDFQGIAEYITDTRNHFGANNCVIASPPKIMDGGQGVEVTIEGDPAFVVGGAESGASLPNPF